MTKLVDQKELKKILKNYDLRIYAKTGNYINKNPKKEIKEKLIYSVELQ